MTWRLIAAMLLLPVGVMLSVSAVYDGWYGVFGVVALAFVPALICDVVIRAVREEATLHVALFVGGPMDGLEVSGNGEPPPLVQVCVDEQTVYSYRPELNKKRKKDGPRWLLVPAEPHGKREEP